MKVFFSRKWSFMNNFFDMGDTKIKITPPCSPRQAGSKYVLFYLERSISKFDLRSGQVKVRSWPKLDQYAHCLKRLDGPRQSFGTICASLSPSCRDLLSKNCLWCHLTSGDFPVTPDRQLHPDLHSWGSSHDPERMGRFWSVYAKWEVFSYFPIGI